ncbi:uncharacterized protein LOC127529165 [Erpetoichthys calabaricus]|uniref:uncharacterized protein LOC127529165 n=1 Tax=Erpetoichthys calabaricus TaxID=27687 RepID=UPI002234B5DB|nr:uncharacterized protein LOC127529165 [Erpetoichthys calabaricus]
MESQLQMTSNDRRSAKFRTNTPLELKRQRWEGKAKQVNHLAFEPKKITSYDFTTDGTDDRRSIRHASAAFLEIPFLQRPWSARVMERKSHWTRGSVSLPECSSAIRNGLFDTLRAEGSVCRLQERASSRGSLPGTSRLLKKRFTSAAEFAPETHSQISTFNTESEPESLSVEDLGSQPEELPEFPIKRLNSAPPDPRGSPESLHFYLPRPNMEVQEEEEAPRLRFQIPFQEGLGTMHYLDADHDEEEQEEEDTSMMTTSKKPPAKNPPGRQIQNVPRKRKQMTSGHNNPTATSTVLPSGCPGISGHSSGKARHLLEEARDDAMNRVEDTREDRSSSHSSVRKSDTNYYERARLMSGCGDSSRLKTTKTIEFSQHGPRETKTVLVIQASKGPPRPRSGVSIMTGVDGIRASRLEASSLC